MAVAVRSEAHFNREAGSAAVEIDVEIVRRLSALREESVLDYFWLMHRQDVERLPLLLHLSKVVLERPATWNCSAIRRQHERNVGQPTGLKLDRRLCFACWDGQNRLYFHHIIEVQHGGSNAPRNLVPLCFACHQYLHPWLTDEPAPRHVRGFQSLYDIGVNVVRVDQP